MCIDMDHMVKSVADSRLMLFDLGNEMLYAFCNQVLNQSLRGILILAALLVV